MKVMLVVLLCGALTLGAVAPAHALTAYVDNRPEPGELPEWLAIHAAPGEKNAVVVERKPTDAYEWLTADSVAVAEFGLATTTAGPGCTKVARLINCDVPPHADLVQVDLSLGDGHDTATLLDLWYQWKIYGGGGNDRIDISTADAPYAWGPGGQIYAGPGRDNVNVENNNYDYVDCGSGVDVVKADPIDQLVGC